MELKQILLITDGKSNIGGDPARAAAQASKAGIVVNTIGIIDDEDDDLAADEIKAIALAGNGTWRLVMPDSLSATLCSITYQTVHDTLENILSRQVEDIIGHSVTNIEPAMRLPIIQYIDDMADTIPQKCIILLDRSNSMASKLNVARAAIVDLLMSFKVRKAKGYIAVMVFPGPAGDSHQLICPFTDDLDMLKKKLNLLKHTGNTPTAPALNAAISYMMEHIFIKNESMVKRTVDPMANLFLS